MIQTKLKIFIINFFAVIFAIFVCLIIANVIFIKISTQKIFPRSLSGSLPSILQTFNPDTYNKPTIYFGIFTGIAMLLALISVLTLLPKLILLIQPFGKAN